MTWKDKLEIGLKDDAPFRRDNLPDFQKANGGNTKTKPDDPTRSPEEPGARQVAAATSAVPRTSTKRRATGRSTASSANRAGGRR